LIIFIFLILLAAGGFFYVYYQIDTPLAVKGEAKEVTIEKGMGIKAITQQLEDMGLIRDADYFNLYIYLNNVKNLQAGDYSLSPSMSIPEIVTIVSGGLVNRSEICVTIPEGFAVKEIDACLAQISQVQTGDCLNCSKVKEKEVDGHMVTTGLIQSGELINFDPRLITDHLSLITSVGGGLEGYLFPDTYIFDRKSTAQDIVRKMLDNFDRKVTPEMRDEIEKRNKTLEQIITMASIVQQEASSTEEMPRIAGVFYNRLAINMPLQSDTTVNYITGKGMRQPLIEDTKIDSPYNTYKYKGLPPGPICNPGLEAIKAAIWPEKNDYYYFLHPLNAPTVFSKTEAEHRANKAKWLK
jgi:UPF0755 protein